MANILSIGTTKTEPRAKRPEIVCKHLNGPEYHEYIMRIQTRELGGVSPMLRGRAARQLFPYKNLPPLKEMQAKLGTDFIEVEEVKATAPQILEVMNVPKTGNAEQKQQHWTASELKKYDEFLLGWARWVTDRINGFVRSARCERTTRNSKGICDACLGIAEDESFKRAVRRVSHRQGVCCSCGS
jgi:hypothetical protein